ncbi:DoxX family protein [Methylonatrum kenyense]|nr:DoxX family protein [Methylonatrum kenyense]MCK8514866.1 DoxX family protein [Methylonatrum kenyense]
MNDALGKFILRQTLGILMLFHGVHKLFHGIDGIKGLVVNHGLPELFAYGVYIGEVVAPVLIILGFYARIGALLIVINMLVAIALAHPHELFMLTQHGGWQLELQGFFLFTAVTLFFTGPGAFSVNRR